MRQEAEERKALEAERKKVEQEESKYHSEIEKLKLQLAEAKDDELEKLNARILALQAQLADVIVKKEEISTLANGKAGNVYVISNLGSFGENVFKIGMIRRLNPQDRVDELGNASVPFRFDVHCFIFSNDAVGLENKLHTLLDDRRVNKVNMRKEFFNISLDELEQIVTETEPTAEFNRTMAAEWADNKEIKKDEEVQITFGDALEKYIQERSAFLSPSSIRKYKSMQHNCMVPFKEYQLKEITQNVIQKVINNASTELSPKSVRDMNGLISAVMKRFRPGIVINITLPDMEDKMNKIAIDYFESMQHEMQHES